MIVRPQRFQIRFSARFPEEPGNHGERGQSGRWNSRKFFLFLAALRVSRFPSVSLSVSHGLTTDLPSKQILTTPLSQRYFTAGKLRETLSAQAQATIAAAKSGDTIFIDLHAESMKYLTSIGEAEANTLSANEKDKTHLSTKGTKVFGGIVADLIAAGIPALKGVFVK